MERNESNVHWEISLFWGSPLAKFIDGVKFIKKISMMIRWGGDLPTKYRWGYIEGRKLVRKIM